MIHNLHDDENQNIYFYGGTYLHTHTNIEIQNQECQKTHMYYERIFLKKEKCYRRQKKLFVNEKW